MSDEDDAVVARLEQRLAYLVGRLLERDGVGPLTMVDGLATAIAQLVRAYPGTAREREEVWQWVKARQERAYRRLEAVPVARAERPQ